VEAECDGLGVVLWGTNYHHAAGPATP
jgi:hypothetical protein